MLDLSIFTTVASHGVRFYGRTVRACNIDLEQTEGPRVHFTVPTRIHYVTVAVWYDRAEIEICKIGTCKPIEVININTQAQLEHFLCHGLMDMVAANPVRVERKVPVA